MYSMSAFVNGRAVFSEGKFPSAVDVVLDIFERHGMDAHFEIVIQNTRNDHQFLLAGRGKGSKLALVHQVHPMQFDLTGIPHFGNLVDEMRDSVEYYRDEGFSEEEIEGIINGDYLGVLCDVVGFLKERDDATDILLEAEAKRLAASGLFAGVDIRYPERGYYDQFVQLCSTGQIDIDAIPQTSYEEFNRAAYRKAGGSFYMVMFVTDRAGDHRVTETFPSVTAGFRHALELYPEAEGLSTLVMNERNGHHFKIEVERLGGKATLSHVKHPNELEEFKGGLAIGSGLYLQEDIEEEVAMWEGSHQALLRYLDTQYLKPLCKLLDFLEERDEVAKVLMAADGKRLQQEGFISGYSVYLPPHPDYEDYTEVCNARNPALLLDMFSIEKAADSYSITMYADTAVKRDASLRGQFKSVVAAYDAFVDKYGDDLTNITTHVTSYNGHSYRLAGQRLGGSAEIRHNTHPKMYQSMRGIKGRYHWYHRLGKDYFEDAHAMRTEGATDAEVRQMFDDEYLADLCALTAWFIERDEVSAALMESAAKRLMAEKIYSRVEVEEPDASYYKRFIPICKTSVDLKTIEEALDS